MIRKFFDAAVAESAATTQPSIAELMAKHGQMNNESVGAVPEVQIPEKKEEPKQSEVSPVATTTEPSKSEATLTTPLPAKEEPKAPEPQKVEVPPVQKSWQEVLRSQQPDVVLKELGYDEKAVGFLNEFSKLDPKMQVFLNKWKAGEDLTGYLREMTTDYSKMSAEEVMRHQLKQEYPKASPSQLEVLYKREVVKAYSLDSDDADELAEGQALLEAKADRYRDTFIANQQNNLLPKAPPPPDDSAAKAQAEAERIGRIEAFTKAIEGNDYYKNLATGNKFTYGEGEDQFNFPINTTDYRETLLNDEKWQSKLFEKTADGSLDYSKPKPEYYLTALVAEYGFDIFKEFAKHFKSLGGDKVIAPIENASKGDGSTPAPSEAAPKSVAEAMARQGTLVR